jgi:predicted aspartyl protease
MRTIDRRSLAAGLGLGLAGGRAGRALALPREYRETDRNMAIVAEVKPNSVPANQTIETLRDPYRRMTAPVELNRSGPYYFVVDTGANQSVVSQEIAAALALAPGPTLPLHGVADVEDTPTAIVTEVKIGQSVDKEVLMPVLPKAAIGADGILGLDRLRNQRLTLDFQHHRLDIQKSHFASLPAFTSSVMGRQRSGQLTIVDADLAGIRISAFLDSGAERTIGNPALLNLAIQRNPSGRFFEAPVISVTGKTVPGQVAMLPVLRLGSVRLVDIAITFADLHVFQIWGLQSPAVLVGMDALSVFDSVTLDFGRAEVWFELAPR